MSTGGAGGGGGLVGALRSEAHGNVAGGKVHDGGRNKERRDLARTAFEESPMFALDDVESADAGADVDADAFVDSRSDFEAARLHRFLRRSKGEVDEAAHFLGIFFLDELQRVEVLNLGGDLAGMIGGVELRNLRDATLPCQQVFPDFFGGVAHPADQSNAGNDDPSCQTYFPPFACLPM